MLLRSDRKITDLTVAFLKLAKAAAATDLEPIYARTGKRLGHRLVNGRAFLDNDKIQAASVTLIDIISRRLSPKSGSHKRVGQSIWQQAAEFISIVPEVDEREFAKQMLVEIEKDARIDTKYTLPNYTFKLEAGCNDIRIGPVRACLSQVAAEEQVGTSGPKFVVDGGRGISFSGEDDIFHLPAVCWQVQLNVSPDNVLEEASWLIDVAISLLRLRHNDWSDPLYPTLGDREPHAFEQPIEHEAGLTQTEKTVSYGTWAKSHYYIIDQKVVMTVSDSGFQEIAGQIFQANSQTVAEGLSLGLGWLTRARRASDKSEAFLLYFTALEALLTSDDKSAPVVQTVSRNAAVILTNDIGRRAEMASRLRRLYGARSALVHAGQRNVWLTDLKTIQAVTEIIYRSVLRNVDIKISKQDFGIDLQEAGFGMAWPKAKVP